MTEIIFKQGFYLMNKTDQDCFDITSKLNTEGFNFCFYTLDQLQRIKINASAYLIFNFNLFKNFHFLAQLELVNLSFNFHSLKITDVQNLNNEEILNKIKQKCSLNTSEKVFTFIPQKPLWKEILNKYDKVVFFDNFNTFKYALKKEFRVRLEQELKNYCLKGEEKLPLFLEEYFLKMTPNQKLKYDMHYYNLINYIEKGYLKTLTNCLDKPQADAAEILEKEKLDYFDLGFLISFLKKKA